MGKSDHHSPPSEQPAEEQVAQIVPETDVERAIIADSAWLEGASWGDPRPGHPEGTVASHVADVLRNIDRVALDQ